MHRSEQVSLEQATQQADRDALRKHQQIAEQHRSAILERFPLSEWPTLPLQRYALGTEDSSDSFCYWLEFGSIELGSIRGGSAMKHLIFKRQDGEDGYFPDRYNSVDEAWEAVRAGFVEAFRLSEEGQWDKIDGIPALYGGRAVRTKALHIYFPDDIVPVYSYSHIERFLKILDAYEPSFSDLEVVSLNRELLRAIRGLDAFEGWGLNEVMTLLYEWTDPRDATNMDSEASAESSYGIDRQLLAQAVERTLKPLVRDGHLERGATKDITTMKSSRQLDLFSSRRRSMRLHGSRRGVRSRRPRT